MIFEITGEISQPLGTEGKVAYSNSESSCFYLVFCHSDEKVTDTPVLPSHVLGELSEEPIRKTHLGALQIFASGPLYRFAL